MNSVLAVFFVPSGTLSYMLVQYMKSPAIEALPISKAGVITIVFLAALLIALWMSWGISCVLTVGKRLLKSSAGRSRTSFKAVQKQARPFVVPLVMTDLLRDCIMMLWSVPFVLVAISLAMTFDSLYYGLIAGPLLLPTVIFATRTLFYDIILVAERKEFRDALRSSAKLVKGQTPVIFNYAVGIALCFHVPIVLIQKGLELSGLPVLLAGLIFGIATAVFLVLGLLTTICLYRSLLSWRS